MKILLLPQRRYQVVLVVSSNTASAIVIVKPGMIQDRGLIFGKVYYDTNGNFMHDRYEKTLKGVEIITEDGIHVITDEYR